MSRAAVFLDRDGTLIDELGYLDTPEGVHLYPRAAAAVQRLNAAGWPVCLITNQSGIARGYFTEADLTKIHARLAADLALEGAHLDGILYCPHHPEIGEPPYRRTCDCRKPLPGMVLRAPEELGFPLDLEESWMVGDTLRDLEAGRGAGLGNLVLVRTGKGREAESKLASSGLAKATIVDDLTAAVELILSGSTQGK